MKQLALHVVDQLDAMQVPFIIDAYMQDSIIHFVKHMLLKKHVRFIKQAEKLCS